METLYFYQTFIRDYEGCRIPEPVIVGYNEKTEIVFETYIVLPSKEFLGEDE